jgi:RNA polymerase sigma-70 factor (ECF subfamily)
MTFAPASNGQPAVTDDVQEAAWPDETSETLLDRVKTRDPKAWPRFVSLYGPLVYHWCCRAGFQEADAADIGQEVFGSVFKSISGFERAGPGSFRRWLKTITLNKCRDFVRRKRPGAEGGGGSDAYETLLQVPEGGGEASDDDPAGDEALLLRQAVQLVLSELTPDASRAFLRVVSEDHAPADVAQDLGMTANTVYLIVSRVKRRIRNEFDGLVGE